MYKLFICFMQCLHPRISPLFCAARVQPQLDGVKFPAPQEGTFEHTRKEKEKKKYVSSEKAPHINQGKGATWEEHHWQKRKGQSVRIRRVASRQATRLCRTSPDKFEGEENAQENAWSAQAYEHSAQNEHDAWERVPRRIKAETLQKNQSVRTYSMRWVVQVHKFKFDLQPGSLTVQVAGEHQP